MAEFAQRVKEGRLELPSGCYANYDLEIIDFLSGLVGDGPSRDYQTLKDSLGRRPSLTEYYRSGASLIKMRSQYEHWWGLVIAEGDLSESEVHCLKAHELFLRDVEVTAMTKSFKAVLLESLLENDGLRNPLTLEALAIRSLEVFRRRRSFISDIKEKST